MLPAETYIELAGDPSSSAQNLNDQAFIEATTSVVRDLARAGDVVIIGRGANMILAGVPGVMHVGLVAPMEVRLETAIQREHFTREEAQRYVEELEQARVTFFRKFFKVNPFDPSLYHMMLNMGEVQPKAAGEIIAHAAGQLNA